MKLALALVMQFTIANAALADCPANVAPEPDKAEVSYQGVKGTWFHLEVARCLLGDVKELAKLRTELVPRLTLRASESDAEAVLLRGQVKLAVAGEAAATKALEASERGRRRAEEALDVWYRAPAFLIGVGVVATVVIEIVVVLVFRGLASQ